jgi:hypothetical protein
MPDEITAGKHLWEVHNTGKQHHGIAIVKLSEGVTVEELIKLASPEKQWQAPPPYDMIAALS